MNARYLFSFEPLLHQLPSDWLIIPNDKQTQLQICFPKMAKSGVAYRLCVNKALEFWQNSNRFVIFDAFSANVNVALYSSSAV